MVYKTASNTQITHTQKKTRNSDHFLGTLLQIICKPPKQTLLHTIAYMGFYISSHHRAIFKNDLRCNWFLGRTNTSFTYFCVSNQTSTFALRLTIWYYSQTKFQELYRKPIATKKPIIIYIVIRSTPSYTFFRTREVFPRNFSCGFFRDLR